jgi:hypothetical protein
VSTVGELKTWFVSHCGVLLSKTSKVNYFVMFADSVAKVTLLVLPQWNEDRKAKKMKKTLNMKNEN